MEKIFLFFRIQLSQAPQSLQPLQVRREPQVAQVSLNSPVRASTACRSWRCGTPSRCRCRAYGRGSTYNNAGTPRSPYGSHATDSRLSSSLHQFQKPAELLLEPLNLVPILLLLGVGDQSLKPVDLLYGVISLRHCHWFTSCFNSTRLVRRTSHAPLNGDFTTCYAFRFMAMFSFICHSSL